MTMRANFFAVETTMKRWLTTLCAVLVLAAMPRPAHAVGPVIDWDPAFFWMPGATFNNMPAGGIMQAVGTISVFGPPLDFLNATMPAAQNALAVIDGEVHAVGDFIQGWQLTEVQPRRILLTSPSRATVAVDMPLMAGAR